jgi:DNA-binding transcriptional regulator YhcF (GntR family)
MYLKDKRERKFVEVRKLLLKGIISGDYSGKLPGERQLAETSGCSYLTLRRAVRSLVEDGYLHKVARKGTFIIHSDYDSSVLKAIGIFISENYVSDRFDAASLLSKLIFECAQKKIECIIVTDLDAVHHSDYDMIFMMYPRSSDLVHLEMNFPHDRIIAIEERSDLEHIPVVSSDSLNAALSSVKRAEEFGISAVIYLCTAFDKNKYVKRSDDFKTACGRLSIQYSEIVINNDEFLLSDLENIVNECSGKILFICNSQNVVENLKLIISNQKKYHLICGFNILSERGMIAIKENYTQMVDEVINTAFKLIKGFHPVKKVVVSHVEYHTEND